MKRIRLAAVLALAATVALTATASGVTNFNNAPSGAHYAQGASEPVCTENEATNTVSCTGTEIQGVGNTNATVSLAVDYSASLTCTNRGGSLVEPHSSSGSDTTTAELRSTRNGRLIVSPTSETITNQDVTGDFTCPNRNWTENVTDINITGFTYTLTFAGFNQPAIVITG